MSSPFHQEGILTQWRFPFPQRGIREETWKKRIILEDFPHFPLFWYHCFTHLRPNVRQYYSLRGSFRNHIND